MHVDRIWFAFENQITTISSKLYLNCYLNNYMKSENMNQELQMITKMETNVKWFNLHYTEIRERYENKFIAIKDDHIIAEDDNVENLIENIEKQGEDPGLTLIEFIPEKGTVLIL